MRKLLGSLPLLLLLSLPALSYADADDELASLRGTASYKDWTLVKNDSRKNIKIYIKQEEGKRNHSFKIDMLADAPMSAIARVYFDIENYPRWLWQVRDAKLLKRVSDSEYYYYLVHDAPVTLPDRDIVMNAHIEPYNHKRGFMALTLKAVPEYLPEKPPLVRMLAEDMVVKIYPISTEQSRVEIEGYFDPGGVAPVWAINAVQRQAPYFTMIGLQRMAESTTYKNASHPLPYPIED